MKKLTKNFIIILIIIVAIISIFSGCKRNKCANGHTWELTSTTATCFDSGVESYSCKVCKSTKTENVNAYGHDLVQSSYTAPTCKTNGEKVEKCSRCGFESKQTLLTVDHDYQVKSSTPSTCTVKGSQLLECSMCHETKTDTLPLKDHDYQLVNEKPSTCAIKGSKDFKCKDCDDSYSTELDLLNHNYELINNTPSTCSTTGSKDYKCSVCHDTYSDKLPLVEHKYSETLVEEPTATCFTKGEMAKKCDVCSNTVKQSETPLLAHNFDEDGYCTKCGIYKTLFDENAIEATFKGVVISGYLTAKFNEANKSIADTYWKDHTVTLTITMFDNDGEELEKHSFNSTTIPHEGNNFDKMTIQYVDVGGRLGNSYANAFIVFVDEGNIFSVDSRTNCKSFKIELSCKGYETIEKVYNLVNS